MNSTHKVAGSTPAGDANTAWTAAEERMPPKMTWVLLYDPNSGIHIGRWYENTSYRWENVDGGISADFSRPHGSRRTQEFTKRVEVKWEGCNCWRVTHWMPLPTPPNNISGEIQSGSRVRVEIEPGEAAAIDEESE